MTISRTVGSRYMQNLDYIIKKKIEKESYKLYSNVHEWKYSGIPLSRTLKGDGKSVRVSECPS